MYQNLAQVIRQSPQQAALGQNVGKHNYPPSAHRKPSALQGSASPSSSPWQPGISQTDLSVSQGWVPHLVQVHKPPLLGYTAGHAHQCTEVLNCKDSCLTVKYFWRLLFQLLKKQQKPDLQRQGRTASTLSHLCLWKPHLSSCNTAQRWFSPGGTTPAPSCPHNTAQPLQGFVKAVLNIIFPLREDL